MKPIALLAVLLSAACTAANPEPSAVAPATLPAAPTLPAASDSQAPMRPLHGTPLEGRTGLQVLIGSLAPAVFDVDRDSFRPITGLSSAGLSRTSCAGSPLEVGDSTVVTAGCPPASRVYLIPPGSLRARPLAVGEAVAATHDRRGVWVRTMPQRGKCSLQTVGLDGRALGRRMPIDCRVTPWAATPLGLLIENTVRDAGRTVFRGDGAHDYIVQIIGRRVLTAEYGKPLRLTDVATRKVREIPAPTEVGTASIGTTSPDGRWVAISYETPAWPGPRQRMDVWLLDTATLQWLHMPSMPVPVALKMTDLDWTRDGRLVLLGTFDATDDKDMNETLDALAVWRPGEPQLRVRRIHLPPEYSAGLIVVR